MPDLEYNINANVTGGEDVTALKEDLAAIEENPTVTVDAGGITEAAEGLGSIETSGAPETLDRVGTSAGTADPKVGGLGASFKDMVAAIGVATIAGYGIDFVMGQISGRLDYIAATKAWDAARVQTYADALSEVSSDVEAISDVIRQLSDEPITDVTGLFGLGGGEEIPNIAAALGAFGITAEEVLTVIRGGEPELDAFNQRLDDVGASGSFGSQVMGVLAGEQQAAAEATATHSAENVFYAETQESANRALQGLTAQRDPMGQFTDEWSLLMESMSDGSIDTTAAANALNTLTGGLELTTDEVLALAQAEIDKVLEEAAAGAQAFADAVGNIDFDAAELTGATSAFSAFTTELFAAGNEAQARETAFDALAESAHGVELNFNTATEAGRAQQDALEGVARTIDTDLATAYDNANGNQEAFIMSATELGDQTLVRLQEGLGLTDEQTAALAVTLGLTAQDYQARFDLAGEEEARLQLELLQGAIEGLPPEVELRVNTLIAQGELVAARDEVTAYYSDPANQPTATVAVEADTAPATTDIEDAAAHHYPKATIVADADTVTAATDLLDTALEPRTATIVAHAHVAGAEIDLAALADAPRTAKIDVDALLSDFEREMEFATRPRTVNVTVNASNVSTRFGSRWSG